MTPTQLRSMNDKHLVESTRDTVKRERQATIDVLRHLEEIQRRELFLDRGYPSLFEMCIKEFGYSNGAVQRRLDALKLMKAVPEVEAKIESGAMNLSAAASIQSFIQLEERTEKIAMSPIDKLELIEACEGKSSREVDRELAKLNPEFVRRESAKPVGEDDMRITVTVTEELWRKMEQLKALRSHSIATTKTEELLAWLVELGLDKLDPARKAERAQARKTKDNGALPNEQRSLPAPEVMAQREPSSKRTRYITAGDRHALASTHPDGCDFVDSETGRRCGSPFFLQRDHIVEFAAGGSNEAENLRWYCGPHNRRRNSSGSRVRCASVEYLAS